ncbi:hypothetical protein [Sphingomonas bacterium]|uniref:hypothetical protein n=1 Tax=Sphingomonas bacterium TaxID=1895847 RepID=UPI0015759594|nr:hypothetical protein [Sphingomonas bacterium]
MTVRQFAAGAVLAAAVAAATPATAQFFLQSHDFSGGTVKGDEPGMTVPLPGATSAEYKAALAWTMRSALNLAALQCQFEPTLHTVETYNAILKDHDAEFDKDQATLQKYYARTPGAGRATAGKGSKAGQAGFDQFGTRTYSAFAVVSAQYGFCQTAAAVGREALFAPRGTFGDLAERRMRQLRNSLVPAGEERFPYYLTRTSTLTPLPRLDAQCWNKKSEWQAGKCGAQNWPPAAAG